MSMFKWDVVDPGAGRGSRCRRSACAWGKTVGPRRPARGRDVRRDLRLPAGHGARPQPGHHVLGHLHDPVPADRAEPGAQLPRHQRLVRGQRRRDPRSQGGDSADVTGAIMVAGLVLAAGRRRSSTSPAPELIHRILPPAVTGAVVMLIGFNLAPVVAGIYWPQDQWIALLTAAFMVFAAVLLPGFWSRIAVFLALIFGYLLSLARRHRLRADHLRARRRHRRRPSTTGSAGPASRPPTGSASRAAPSPTASPSSTARASR